MVQLGQLRIFHGETDHLSNKLASPPLQTGHFLSSVDSICELLKRRGREVKCRSLHLL